ncbi:LysR family transcriptional regulator [Roseobacter sinensis]|uniref:LysR family transcriptional regulator n=1 Tax=Roseobacter sinensis TaxID=2931391 RepID=A0ABT3B9I6_9RHOB|nr:LysR family transcriptional regulator [Roseobacter sp. WL0113]MCV3269834.1 LysR family transcriptional regulator [Roseobacter sp. WL0113]
MRLSGFNLNQLTYLEALLVECNVTRAAQRVHLSQSAMSAVLAQLRDHFRDELLVRSGRTMVRTPFAEGLIAPMNALLSQAQSFAALRPGAGVSGIARDLSVVASDYVMRSSVVPAIERAATEMPGLRFDLLPLSGGSARQLQTGEVDLLLAGQSLDVGLPPKARVFTDSFVCLSCAECGPEAGALTSSAYLERDHVVVRYSRHQTLFDDEEVLRRAGQSRRRKLSVWSYSLVPDLICGKGLIATVPARAARQIAARWPVRVHPFPFDHDAVSIYAFWHSSRDKDDVLARFLRMLA